MEKCSRCGADTQLHVNGVPVCANCDKQTETPIRIPAKGREHPDAPVRRGGSRPGV
jgi:hypothetical protein